MSRRGFIKWAAAGTTLGAGVVWRPSSAVQVTNRTVLVPGLAEPLCGIRVAQISDTHLPSNAAAARETIGHIDRLQPEIVVLTGDIFETADGLSAAMAFAHAVRGTIATFAVPGNWEQGTGLTAEDLSRAYAEAGVEFLSNTARTVVVDGAPLSIVGLDDPAVGRPDPSAAAAQAEPGAPAIWLMHTPGMADDLAGGDWAPPRLILSGHTHGGQVRFPGLPPLVLPRRSGRFISGYYDDSAGPLYVSRGIGTSGLRIRVFCPAELPLFTLQRG